MQQRRKIRYLIAFVLLTAGILVLLLCNIGIGTVKIPLTEILTTGRTKEGMNARILWEIRLPRTLAAGILGGALALAGYLLQTFFHNPIADVYKRQTLSQVIPEKLPRDQLWRFTISASSAKVTTSSVMAEQM